MGYEEAKEKDPEPDFNWTEAEEISEEDLQAAQEYLDRIIESRDS